MEKDSLLHDDLEETSSNDLRPNSKGRVPSCSRLPTIVASIDRILLLFSLCLNCTLIWLLSQQLPKSYGESEHGLSSLFANKRLQTDEVLEQIASLLRNLNTPYYEETPYGANTNDSYEAVLWHSIDIDSGVIALSDDYVALHNLIPAERFPWDATKGIYIVHGYHNLHCLVKLPLISPIKRLATLSSYQKIIYISMDEYRRGEPQSRQWGHISHCFDALRRQILCDADDTPRAVQADRDGVSGIGQSRQCRDWALLEIWAKKHTACYRRPERPIEGMRNIEKFRFCPEGSEYSVPLD
ncbi:MAG: hypothetical protein Q9225_001928 [Loekoesia sp. 1 TL-2023]